jgi:hypothetical protein
LDQACVVAADFWIKTTYRWKRFRSVIFYLKNKYQDLNTLRSHISSRATSFFSQKCKVHRTNPLPVKLRQLKNRKRQCSWDIFHPLSNRSRED